MELTYKLLHHQLDLLHSVKPIAGIYAGRGSGKSMIISLMTALNLINGKKILVLAQNYKSLSQNLFAEIRKRLDEMKLDYDFNSSAMTIKYDKGICYGYSYDGVEAVRGLSEIEYLYLDELALAKPDLLAIVGPCCRGNFEPKIRFASTPRKGSYWDNWVKNGIKNNTIDVFTAKMDDNVYLSKESLALAKEAIKDDTLYRQEILGEILDDTAEFSILKLSDFCNTKSTGTLYTMGIDCAGLGSDNNEFVVTDGYSIIEEKSINIGNSFELSNIATEFIRKYNIKKVNIDITGSTVNGLYDILHLRHGDIINGINFAQSPIDKEKYANARAEMYFNLSDKVRNGFYIDDDEIKKVLTITQYQITNSGKFILQPKSEIKEIIGHSPDLVDALVLSLYNRDNIESYTPEHNSHIAMKFVGI